MMMTIVALAARDGLPSAHGATSETECCPELLAGDDGLVHDVSQWNGRALAGGTAPMRRMSPPQSGHGKMCAATVEGASHGRTFGSTG
jgi:hypothetical protein